MEPRSPERVRSQMRTQIKPTQADLKLARAIARNTRSAPEAVAQTLTYAADEHLLVVLAACYWLYCRPRSAEDKRASDHVLVTTIVASVVPHLLKSMFYQIRPDRRTVRGHLHGVPLSGSALDAFPSGHAIHVGALASAASRLREPLRTAAWLL